MSRSFLFGGQHQSQQSKYLVEFRAGKMTMSGTTVTPIKKKGLVYLNQSDDHLMHFCWKDRQTGNVEDDLIIFPDDAEFKRVKQCTTGRVYVLLFKSSSRRCFFWMQEPNEEKDEELCRKVNQYLNDPPTPNSRSGSQSQNLANINEIGSLPEHDIQNLLSNVNPAQLMQMIGGLNTPSLSSLMGSSSSGRSRHAASSNTQTPTTQATATSAATSTAPSATATTVASAASSSSSAAPAIQLSDLQSIISGLSVTQAKKPEGSISLSSAINSDALRTLLDNKDFMERVKEFLPQSNDESVKLSEQPVSVQLSSTIQSPQFQSALNTFNSALQSGMLGPLMRQFNLSEECVEAANKGDLEEFVKAMEKSASKNKVPADKKDDDEMALD